MKDILAILEQNARATPEEISEMTGRATEEVRAAIAEAERSRAIVKYKTLVNWDRLGEQEVLALVELRVTPQRDVGFDGVAGRIARFPEVRSLHLMSGDYDLSVAAGRPHHAGSRQLRSHEAGCPGGSAWHHNPLPSQAVQGGRGYPGQRGGSQASPSQPVGEAIERRSRRHRQESPIYPNG